MPRRRPRSADLQAALPLAVTTALSSLGLWALPGQPLDWAVLPCLGASAPVWAAAVGWVWRKLGRKRRRWLYGAASLVPSVLTGFALPHGANQLGDVKLPVRVLVTIERVDGSGLAVAHSEQGGRSVQVPAPGAAPGQVVGVELRRGLFNWRWAPRP